MRADCKRANAQNSIFCHFARQTRQTSSYNATDAAIAALSDSTPFVIGSDKVLSALALKKGLTPCASLPTTSANGLSSGRLKRKMFSPPMSSA